MVISNLVKTEKFEGSYVLFNKAGLVLELNRKEYRIFREHADKQALPITHRQFFKKLCDYGVTSFRDYTPEKPDKVYSKRLLGANTRKPAFKAPIITHLGLTNTCNMGCEYCSVRQGYFGMNELTTEEWKGVITKLADLGVFQIGLTGGEPTLRKDLLEIAKHIEDSNCTFNLTTNAYNLDEDLIKKLVAAGLRQCQVSLDSNIASVNDKLRGKGTCDRIKKGIKLLKKHAVCVGIDCVVSNNNIDYIPQLVRWLSENSIQYLTLIKIKQGALSPRRFSVLLPGYSKYCATLENLAKRRNTNPCVTIDCGSVNNLQNVLKEEELETVPVAGCPSGHTLLSIAPNGDIYPCVALGGSEFKVGNALNDDLKDLWLNSPVLGNLREVKKRVTGRCASCNRLDYCRGGCRGLAYSLSSKLWASDITCNRGGEKNGSNS